MASFEELNADGFVFVPLNDRSTPIRGFKYDPTPEKDCLTQDGVRYDQVSIDDAVKEVEEHFGSVVKGFAVIHSYSGTCCIDIDDWDYSQKYLIEKYDFDLESLREDEHFEVISPSSNRGKFMFMLPSNASEIGIKKHKISNEEGNDALDFRGISNVYDVWPYSIHRKTGKPYTHEGAIRPKEMPLKLLKIWIQEIKENARSFTVDEDTNKIKFEDGKSSVQRIQEIIAGVDLHDNLLNHSMYLIHDDVECKRKNSIIATLEGLMMVCHPDIKPEVNKSDPNRWQARFDLIPRMVEDGYSRLNKTGGSGGDGKLSKDDVTNIINDLNKSERQYREIPWPPGRFGEFCKGIKRSQGIQYDEMSILTGIMALAAVAGKSFNISDAITSEINVNQNDPNVQRALGGNLFCAILGDSGSGKGEFEKTIEQLIYHGSGLNSNSSFLLHNDFSSGTNIQKDLINAKCGISILDEAGASLLSQSGDPMKRKVVVLDAWAKSGYNRTLLRQKINGEENKIPRIRGAAFSMAMLSSPRKFKQAFYQQGSVDDGMAPRTLILSLTPERGVRNWDVAWDFPDGTLEKFAALQKMGSEIQAKEFHVPHFIWLPNHIREDAKRLEKNYTKEKNELVKVDYNKGIMLNRAYETTLRVANLITVYNKDKEDPGCLRVDEEEWEWAKSFVKYFTDGTDDFFTGAFFGDEMQEAMKIVRYEISRIIEGHKMAEKAANVPIGIAKNGYFTKTSLSRRLKNKNEINAISSKASYSGKYKKGLDKVLDYLMDEGEIKKVGKVPGLKARNAFQITNFFGEN